MKKLKNIPSHFDTPDVIRDRFNKKVDIYESEISETIPDYFEYLDLMVELINSQKGNHLQVIDLGCGPGFAAKHIAENVKRKQLTITLVDFAENLLERAHKSISIIGINVHPVCCDFRDFNFENEKYDVIISSLALHHLRQGEKEAFYTKLFSSVKNGGLFLNFDELMEGDIEVEIVLRDKWTNFIRQLGWKEVDIENLFKEIFEGEDSPETLENEIRMLKKVGFQTASLIQRKHLFGLIVSRKSIIL